MDFYNKTIVITGGASGIGLALVKHLSKNNRVFKLHPEVRTYPCDITSEDEVLQWVTEVKKETSTVDILMNNAGVGRLNFLDDPTFNTEKLRPELEVNFVGQVRVTHHFLPLISRTVESGILFMSSGFALVPYYKSGIYSASKAALHSYVQSLRTALCEEPFKIIEIFPPLVDTRLNSELDIGMPINDYITLLFEELTKGEEEVAMGEVKELITRYKKAPLEAYAYVQSLDHLRHY